MNKDTFAFFEELAKNNNRDWFLNNKKRFDTIHEEFVELTAEVIDAVSTFDHSIGHPDAKRCIYRIYRDLRFTTDKRPYKEHISFFLSSNGIKRSGEPGYYLQIGQEDYGLSGNCTLGGGIFMPDKEKLYAIRQEIFYNTDEFLSIVNDSEYLKYFGNTLFTSKQLQRAPKGFPNNWPHADLLKFNDYCTMHSVSKNVVLDKNFRDYIVNVFRASAPLNRFILKAIS